MHDWHDDSYAFKRVAGEANHGPHFLEVHWHNIRSWFKVLLNQSVRHDATNDYECSQDAQIPN